MNERPASEKGRVPAAGRISIVFDGKAWYVRAVRLIEHDMERDEKIYRCDRPIGNDYSTLQAAVSAIRWKPRRKAAKKPRS